MKMAETTNRMDRELDKREQTKRPARWMPPQLLPDPKPEPGYVFRWIRLSTLGTTDPGNISSKLREGWEPVKASDHPEIRLFGDQNNSGQFKDTIQIGGLMLCKIPAEFMEQRSAHYSQQAEAQMNSVDNNFMRENDPRMPLFRERSSKVTFGKGS
jgi:hypothetical protein